MDVIFIEIKQTGNKDYVSVIKKTSVYELKGVSKMEHTALALYKYNLVLK